MTDAYYFGCGDESGHFWWLPSHRPFHRPTRCPWGYEVDGGAQPGCYIERGHRRHGDETEGPCALHRRDGWTLIGWWDRSVDKRPACCSAFAARGEHDFAAMVVLLREAFPWVAARMRFDLAEAP
jgi:hypothetical protein